MHFVLIFCVSIRLRGSCRDQTGWFEMRDSLISKISLLLCLPGNRAAGFNICRDESRREMNLTPCRSFGPFKPWALSKGVQRFHHVVQCAYVRQNVATCRCHGAPTFLRVLAPNHTLCQYSQRQHITFSQQEIPLTALSSVRTRKQRTH